MWETRLEQGLLPGQPIVRRHTPQPRAANPAVLIVARGHSHAEAAHLTGCVASVVVQGAEEIAHAMVDQFRRHTAKA